MAGKSLALGLVALALSASLSWAAPVQFYDAASGANFVRWWETTGIPKCSAEAGAHVSYATSDAISLYERLMGSKGGIGDVDLVNLDNDRLAQFEQAGLLEDLRKYSNLIPNLSKTQPPDNETAAGVSLNGVGAVFMRFGYGITYNSHVVPNPPKSFRELYARRNEWNGKISYVDPRSPNSPAGREFVAGFLRAFGADLKLHDGKESASWAKAWSRLAEFERATFPKHPETVGPLMTLYASGDVVIGSTPVDYIAYRSNSASCRIISKLCFRQRDRLEALHIWRFRETRLRIKS